MRDDGQRQMLVGEVDGHECTIEVRRWSERIVEFKHTVVSPALRGEGVGQRFVSAALGWARRGGQRVIPSCPFVKKYVEEHPEESELVVERAAQPDPDREGGPNP
jgi:predicted GNAT family acetyltransferase